MFLLIVGIFLYDNVKTAEMAREGFSINKYMENPQKYGGREFEHMTTIVNISQDHFYIKLGGKDIKVIGSDIKKPIFGEIVVYLDYKKNGRIELIDYHTYDYNYILYILSIFALIVFIMMFFKEWKIAPRGFKNA